MRFNGTRRYIATEDLQIAVNAAIVLERPLLVKGEPGTGKTVLAEEIALALGRELITWHIKSTTKAQQGLYEYDAVSRLRDSQIGDRRVSDISHYIKRGKLWEAFAAPARPVLLIDEVDKADIEFPNDLLLELDRMEFHVYETGETIRASTRPIVVITSNNEKELPDAFLRRCFFHYIRFPDRETMQQIVDVHFPQIKQRLVEEALRIFFDLREFNRPEEEAVDFGTARLAEAAGQRGCRPGNPARARCEETGPATLRRPPEKRTGCARIRTPGLHRPARKQGRLERPRRRLAGDKPSRYLWHGLLPLGRPVDPHDIGDMRFLAGQRKGPELVARTNQMPGAPRLGAVAGAEIAGAGRTIGT